MELGQTESNKWTLLYVFLHYLVFNHPGPVMMLIMMSISYIPDSFQKQRQLRQIDLKGNSAGFEGT